MLTRWLSVVLLVCSLSWFYAGIDGCRHSGSVDNHASLLALPQTQAFYADLSDDGGKCLHSKPQTQPPFEHFSFSIMGDCGRPGVCLGLPFDTDLMLFLSSEQLRV